MRVAVIGGGIAGNVAAYHLCKKHEVTLFEAADHLGGHTHTHDIEWDGWRYAVDTGFIVFNERITVRPTGATAFMKKASSALCKPWTNSRR